MGQASLLKIPRKGQNFIMFSLVGMSLYQMLKQTGYENLVVWRLLLVSVVMELKLSTSFL